MDESQTLCPVHGRGGIGLVYDHMPLRSIGVSVLASTGQLLPGIAAPAWASSSDGIFPQVSDQGGRRTRHTITICRLSLCTLPVPSPVGEPPRTPSSKRPVRQCPYGRPLIADCRLGRSAGQSTPLAQFKSFTAYCIPPQELSIDPSGT
jgi:hypothetical protein